MFERPQHTRDDVLLAFGSLFLLLVIEGIVTSFLFRTENSIVSNFGFSVRQVAELIREFILRRLFAVELVNSLASHVFCSSITSSVLGRTSVVKQKRKALPAHCEVNDHKEN